jgi:hypothetical protein
VVAIERVGMPLSYFVIGTTVHSHSHTLRMATWAAGAMGMCEASAWSARHTLPSALLLGLLAHFAARCGVPNGKMLMVDVVCDNIGDSFVRVCAICAVPAVCGSAPRPGRGEAVPYKDVP